MPEQNAAELTSLLEELHWVATHARCLLWSADVRESGNPAYLAWSQVFPEQAAQEFLPLDLRPGETYKEAWYRCRLPEDRDRCDAIAGRSIRAGHSYEQEFRIRCADGSLRWIREDLRVETVTAGRHWRVVAVATDIQGKREAEEELRYVMAHAGCLLWHADVWEKEGEPGAYRWRVLVFDEAAAQRFLPLDVRAGETYTDALHRSKPPEDARRMNEISSAALGAGQSHYSQEFRCRRLDGDLRWLHEETTVEPVSPGRWRVAGVYTDVTRRKRQEEALHAAHAAEHAAHRRAVFLAEASRVLAASLDYRLTLRNVARVAVPDFADWCYVDLLQEDGTLETVAAAHADPRKEGVAWELRRRYTPRPDTPHGVRTVLRTGRAEWLPNVADEFLEAIAQDDEHLRLYRELGIRSIIRAPLIARGETFGVISVGFGESGRRYGREDLALLEDLGCRAATAIDNAALHRELEDASRRKDEFLAMLAHELRTPLAAVANADYVLDEIGSDDPRVSRLRSVISRQTQHLSRLVDDLLDISRITRGKIELRKAPVELGVIVHRATETTAPLIRQRGHKLTVSVPDEAIWLEADPTRLEQVLSNLLNNAAKYTEPGGRIDLSVEVDGNRLVVDGQSEPSTINHQPSTAAVIRVRDTGIGIAPEQVPHVFDLFTQAARTSDQSQGGLGIGLALVRNLVEMHGGTVAAFSKGPGRGSEFVVRLPVLKAEGGRMKEEGGSVVGGQWSGPAFPADVPSPNARVPAERVDRTPNADLPPSAFRLHPSRRVLIVEDSEDAAETLADILDLWGHDVRRASNGPAALEAARDYAPEVVLLDIGLPGMDGYEVARRLRSAEAEGPPAGNMNGAVPHRMLLIALTGFGQQSARQRSQEAGFDLHLTKPVDPQELRRVLAFAPGCQT